MQRDGSACSYIPVKIRVRPQAGAAGRRSAQRAQSHAEPGAVSVTASLRSLRSPRFTATVTATLMSGAELHAVVTVRVVP